MASDLNLNLNLRYGYKFSPSDSDLLRLYLRPKLLPGEPQPSITFPELDLHGSPLPPWKLIDPSSSRPHRDFEHDHLFKEWFCFTPLKNKTTSRSWTWTASGDPTAVFAPGDPTVLVGYKRVYDCNFAAPTSGAGEGEWIMHEFTLPDLSDSMAVCRVINNVPEPEVPYPLPPPLPLDAPFPWKLQMELKDFPKAGGSTTLPPGRSGADTDGSS